MSVLLADPGGEYYFSLGAGAAGVWSQATNVVLTSSAPVGRATAFAIAGGTSGLVERVLPTNYSHLIMGGAYFINSGLLFSAVVIMGFIDTSNLQCEVRIDVSGHWQITRNGVVLGTSSTLATPGQGWVYLELEVTFATSGTGSAQLWVNGVSVLNLSSVQTANTNASANRVRFGSSIINSQNAFWKDMYVLDASTSPNNSVLGDVTVSVIYPNAAGANQQWSNTGGASQTASVQDGISGSGTRPDGDTTYISDTVSGHISDFAHQTLVASTLYAVVHVSYVRSDSGASNFQQVSILGGSTHATGNIALGGTYNYYFDPEDTDPAGAGWTVSNFNSTTFGVKVP